MMVTHIKDLKYIYVLMDADGDLYRGRTKNARTWSTIHGARNAKASDPGRWTIKVLTLNQQTPEDAVERSFTNAVNV